MDEGHQQDQGLDLVQWQEDCFVQFWDFTICGRRATGEVIVLLVVGEEKCGV